ncbi:response regulator [Paenibacillus albiflavus]|uniref:Response regulator n=1 Tax=Paenibacillus albiflavus TaxID=2545760 RepID=A0A4R4EGQ0_9BACL|nr:response regulator [Paenibacillus albiflavus]TCZ79256.1 response regulator [Paenibacillus albiflavus]
MSTIKAMVVDDAAFMRLMIRNILEASGHQVIAEASNGKQAVELYKQHRPDLVTMDITMPEMDGIQAVKRIKQFDSSAKIIMCSALGQREFVLDAIFHGASDFIVKPINKDRVLEAVRNLFASPLNQLAK